MDYTTRTHYAKQDAELTACGRVAEHVETDSKFINSNCPECQRTRLTSYCSRCGGVKPAGQSCICFDNDSQ